MKDISTQFLNERGNAIEMRVEDKDIESHQGVLITITGPNSDTTIHITRLEAETLLQQLSSALQ